MSQLNAIQQHRVKKIYDEISKFRANFSKSPMPDLATFTEMFTDTSTPTQDLCTLAQIVGKDEPKNL